MFLLVENHTASGPFGQCESWCCVISFPNAFWLLALLFCGSSHMYDVSFTSFVWFSRHIRPLSCQSLLPCGVLFPCRWSSSCQSSTGSFPCVLRAILDFLLDSTPVYYLYYITLAHFWPSLWVLFRARRLWWSNYCMSPILQHQLRRRPLGWFKKCLKVMQTFVSFHLHLLVFELHGRFGDLFPFPELFSMSRWPSQPTLDVFHRGGGVCER